MGVWENPVNADEGAEDHSIGHGNDEDELGSIGETADAAVAVVNIAPRALQDGRGENDEPRGAPEYLDNGNNIHNI